MTNLKEDIAHSAIELFKARGYKNVSVNEICEHCGVSRSVFYSVFNGKRAILDYVVAKPRHTDDESFIKFANAENDFERIWQLFERFITIALEFGPELTSTLFIMQFESPEGIRAAVHSLDDLFATLAKNCAKAGIIETEEEPELLSNIVRIFKDIPENCTVDIFGEIYEYFLGNFALAEGKDGGTFYTPATVVRYMVEVLDPQPGDKKFLDPACGSGGMFVQAARYMHAHNANEAEQMKFRCYGVEKEPDTVKLAKMNLLLNNVRGDITEANSFYSDPYNAFGAFDYVMANPPFNVDEVSFDRVSGDARFNTYGVPRNSTKSAKKASDKKETVPNANYLWIGYFATALNEHGKAALVMANSASDAGKSEYEIRKKMIEEGIISQMMTLPSNMFSSVTLPATLWFFDKHKPQTDKKNEILFIDARNVFTQVDRAHRKFSDEQIKNLGIITRLYHGDTAAFVALLVEYREALAAAPEAAEDKETKTKAYWQAQIDWLTERFPDGEYRDVIGLCKAAKLDGEDGIIDQDYSLNAGRYVGVVIEDDGMTEADFKETMLGLNAEFEALNEEAKKLEAQISLNLRGLFTNE